MDRSRPQQSPIVDDELLERERELELIAGLIGSAHERVGGLIVIEGAAGLGKSRLLRWAIEHAGARGLLPLSARGGEPERDLAAGVALQLFERQLLDAAPREREELLRGPAALSLPLFEGRHWDKLGERDQPAHDGLQHGLFWLATNLAERAPLLLAVDDLHWADEPSLRFLLYLLRRLEELPIAVVLTRRPASGGQLADELAADSLAQRLSLEPLSTQAVSTLLANALDDPVGERFAAACGSVTGGNPFLVHSIVRALADEGIAPLDENADRIAELRPDAVRRQALIRIARRGQDAIALSQAAAILGDGAELAHATALARLDPDSAAEAADALLAADILAMPGALRFTHPLVRAAVYEELPPARRERWHARAAGLLHDEHAPAEQIASQLLTATRVGEPWAAQALRQAAARTLASGSPEPAVRFLTRGLREPLERSERGEVLLELARAKAMLGDSSAAHDLDLALELTDDRRTQARARRMLGGVLYTHGDPVGAAREFEQALELIDEPEDPLARELEAAYFSAASLVPALAAGAIARIEPLLGRPVGDESPAERAALAGVAVHLATAGGPREQALALARRAWDDGRLLAEEGVDGWAWSLVTGAFAWTADYEGTLGIVAAVFEQARRKGSLMAYATASFCALHPTHMLGRIAEARAHAEAALDARRYGWNTFPAALAGWHALVLIDQDQLDAAEQALTVLEDPACGTPAGRAEALFARGRLRRLQARPGDALEDLLAAGEIFTSITGPHDTFAPWRTEAAIAAHQLSRSDQAQELVDQAAEIAERTHTPEHQADVLRAHTALTDSPERRVELLTEALASLEHSQSHTERIRCLAELGGALRRAGARAQARATLAQALEQAHQIGATLIERQTGEELRIAGGRPRRLAFSGADALTASERRVAEMAARGAGNREIAQALFVTPRTVEQHLYNTYKKLGINSRTQLADALRAPELAT